MSNTNKIGIGIVTCNREGFFKKLYESINNVHDVFVVNSGETLYGYENGIKHFHMFPQKTPVVFAKNHLFRTMYDEGYDHIFILEDDVLIADTSVFEKYVNTAIRSGIFHLNFGFSQKENLDEKGNPVIKTTLDYGNNIKIVLTTNVLGAFSYYYKGILKNVGLMDEMFGENAFEHVEHTYRIIKAGLLPPFWNFPDIDQSWEYIKNQGSPDTTLIRNDDDYRMKMVRALNYFEQKHGVSLFKLNHVIPEQDVLNEVYRLEKTYGKQLPYVGE